MPITPIKMLTLSAETGRVAAARGLREGIDFIAYDVQDEITLELARLHRATLARVHKRAAEHQLGEGWVGLEAPLS